jgi:hypothetical protein
MLPKWHVLFGAFFSLLIFFIFKITFLEASVIFLSSFLIDIDHYLYYAFTKRKLNLRNAFNWFIDMQKKYYTIPVKKRKNYYYSFLFFHGIESFTLILLLSFLFPIFWFVFIGFFFHYSLDIAESLYKRKHFINRLSHIYYLISIKNKINLEKIKNEK